MPGTCHCACVWPPLPALPSNPATGKAVLPSAELRHAVVQGGEAVRAFGIISSAETEDELKVSAPRSRRTGDLGTAVTQLGC